MTIYQHAGVELDQCERCQGSFLDHGESAALTEGTVDPRSWANEHFVVARGPTQRACPRGHGAMIRHDLEHDGRRIELDLCAQCGGLFLDREEGGRVRALVAEAQRHAEDRESGAIRPGVKHYLFQLFTGFPAEVWNPIKRTPRTVYTLLIALAVLYVFEIVLNLKMPGEWEKYGMCVPADLIQGQRPWTLLSYGFLHGSPSHLLGNLYFLWVFGDNVEDVLGTSKFLIIYLSALILGGLGHVLFNLDSSLPLVGASGAIAGLMGAYLVLFPKVKLWVVLFFIRFRIGVIWYLGFWVGFQLLMAALGGQGVAWWAHIGGFIAGLPLAWKLRPARWHQDPIAV